MLTSLISDVICCHKKSILGKVVCSRIQSWPILHHHRVIFRGWIYWLKNSNLSSFHAFATDIEWTKILLIIFFYIFKNIKLRKTLRNKFFKLLIILSLTHYQAQMRPNTRHVGLDTLSSPNTARYDIYYQT